LVRLQKSLPFQEEDGPYFKIETKRERLRPLQGRLCLHLE